jgi:N-acylneuraminate cytidylyltransferase
MTPSPAGVIAIIPARGGSRGIPRKNLRPVAGKPLIAYAIECALAVPSIARVFVSTEDPEIAATSETFGAEVIDRPPKLSGDTASSESAILHALDHLREVEGFEPHTVAFLQATSPLTTSGDVEGTLALLDEGADSAFTAVPFHHFVWKLDAAGNAIGVNHDKALRLPRQACEPQYLESGAVYAFRTPGFRLYRHRFFGRTAMYVTPASRLLEIDDWADLELAEALITNERLRSKPAGSVLLPA